MQYIVFLITLFLVSCSGAGSQSSNWYVRDFEYTQFDKSSLTMQVGESQELTMYLKNSNPDNIPEPAPFRISKQNIVTFNPEICTLDHTQSPPSCKTIVTAVGIGDVEISGPAYGIVATILPITVTNQNP